MAALLLAACGGDSSSGVKDPDPVGELVEPAEGADSDLVVDTFDDLPVCSSKREGATAYVKDEKTAYICEDGDWTADGDSPSSSSATPPSSSSATTEDLSSSSDKVTEPAERPTSSSSFVYVQSSGAYEQPEVVAVKDKSISGVSQKGPFVTGSAVKLYELDGKTYAQTGKSFTGKIASDDGKFSVASVTLASQYALLEANGYFRNEITGAKSSGTVTLNALTDLSDRKNVNINLLTHLEYERALYLVSTGINVPSAKKQAEAEIFNAFGIRGEFENSEDLDIFSKGEGNAALLAFSVLMLRDLSEADLTELLTKFATDIEKDGSWDDETTKAEIADWAQSRDLAGSLETIRSNIASWNFGTVPDFEKYVRNFWYANYGLGSCSTTNEGEVAATRNELSYNYGTQTRFICKSGAWVWATVIEKDFYNSEKIGGDDGEIWTGPVSGVKYKYDEALDKWVPATKNDTTLMLMACTTNRTGEIGQSSIDSKYYVCKSFVDSWSGTQGHDWQIAQEIDYDTYGEKCTSAEVGNTISGVVTATNKYYCTANGWVNLMDWSWDVPKEARLNPEITYGTMTDSRDGKVYRTVTIGTQTWMAENLNFDPGQGGSGNAKYDWSWCFNDVAANCDVAGRLYTWAAAMDSVKLATDADNPLNCGGGKTCGLSGTVRGVCPSGWHLPDTTEWETLFTAVGGKSTAGKVLKSQTGWYNNFDGTDTFGFSALPAGFRDYDGYYVNFRYFYNAGYCAFFWSSTENNGYGAYIMAMNFWLYINNYNYKDDAYLDDDDKYDGYSVRCLKD